MNFPSTLKSLSLILLAVMIVGLFVLLASPNIDSLLAAILILGAALVFLILYSISFALDKLDRIHHNSKAIAKASLAYLQQHPLREDAANKES